MTKEKLLKLLKAHEWNDVELVDKVQNDFLSALRADNKANQKYMITENGMSIKKNGDHSA